MSSPRWLPHASVCTVSLPVVVLFSYCFPFHFTWLLGISVHRSEPIVKSTIAPFNVDVIVGIVVVVVAAAAYSINIFVIVTIITVLFSPPPSSLSLLLPEMPLAALTKLLQPTKRTRTACWTARTRGTAWPPCWSTWMMSPTGGKPSSQVSVSAHRTPPPWSSG